MRWICLAGMALLPACGAPIWVSDGGTFQVSAPSLSVGRGRALDPVRRVLLGSQTGLEVRVDECFATRFEGGIGIPAMSAGVGFSAPGPAVIHVVPTDCAPPDAVADRLTLEVVPPTALSGAAVEWEGYLFDSYIAGDVRTVTEVEPRLFAGVGEDIALPADETIELGVRLLADGEPVAVGEGVGRVEVTGAVAAASLSPLITEVWTGAEGGGEVQFVRPGHIHPLFNWHTARPRDLRRLRIQAALIEGDEGAGVAAQPWLEDREGRRVVGVPVQWEVKGRHQPPIPDPLVGGVYFEPTPCLRPSQRGGVERMTIVARVAGMRDAVTVDVSVPFPEGTPDELAALDQAFFEEPPEACVEVPNERTACGCASPVAPPALLVSLVALVVLRRRGVRRGSSSAAARP